MKYLFGRIVITTEAVEIIKQLGGKISNGYFVMYFTPYQLDMATKVYNGIYRLTHNYAQKHFGRMNDCQYIIKDKQALKALACI